MTGLTDIKEIAQWYALSPLAPWFWARLAALLIVAALLAWWALRTPEDKPESRAKRLAATRQTLAAAVRAVDAADKRAPAKLAQAVRTLLDALHGGRSFRAATALEISKRVADARVNAFFRAAQRPLYAPGGVASPAEVENFRTAALDIIETYQPK